MAVFKDLMNAIFNEEVDSDEELEEIEEYEEPEVVAPKPVVVEEPVVVSKPVQPVQDDQFAHPTPTPIKTETKPASNFVEINVDDAPRAPKAKKSKKVGKAIARAQQQEAIDYTPIISPIFGNTEESKKEFDKVHNAIDLKKPVEEEAFTTIISPMYGKNLPKAKRVIPTMEVEVDLSLDEMLEESKEEKISQESLFGKK